MVSFLPKNLGHSARDMKLLQEVEEETAKMLSPLFNDTVWLNRAHTALKGINTPLNEGRFKSLVLVLNGRIKQYLRLSNDVGTLNTAKIFSYIIELDTLISEAMKLPRTPSLDHFQSYAKGILFRNIGDTFLLLHNNEKGSTTYDELSYTSYLLAFDALQKASPVSSLLAAVFILETLILRTLLQHFNAVKLSKVTTQQVGERLYKACNGVSTQRSKSFMVSISSVPSNYEMHAMEQKKIARIVPLADKDEFLVSLLWLLAYSKDLRDNVSFLDPFIRNIPAGSYDDDLQSFTESSLSKVDVKVLLLGAAQWTKLNSVGGQKHGTFKLGILPLTTFAQPSFMMLKFWNLIVAFGSGSETRRSGHQCSESGLIISALEASRLRGEIPDLRIVDSVRKWLIANGNALGDKKGNWAKLYSQIFMDYVNGAHYVNQGVLAEDSFFPPLDDLSSTTNDYDMLDDAEVWLTRQSPSFDQNKAENGGLVDDEPSQTKKLDDLSTSKTEPASSTKVKRKSLLQRLNIKTKGVLSSEYRHLVASPHASKSECIKALKELNKDYETKDKTEASVNVGSSGFLTSSPAVGNNEREQELHAQITKLQDENATIACRLVQTANSLQERAQQYTTDSAVNTLKAYRQGYGDGYYVALQALSSHTASTVPTYAHTLNTSLSANQGISVRDQVQESVTDTEHPHNPKDCLGCASEEDQDLALRILDSLAESHPA